MNVLGGAWRRADARATAPAKHLEALIPLEVKHGNWGGEADLGRGICLCGAFGRGGPASQKQRAPSLSVVSSLVTSDLDHNHECMEHVHG